MREIGLGFWEVVFVEIEAFWLVVVLRAFSIFWKFLGVLSRAIRWRGFNSGFLEVYSLTG